MQSICDENCTHASDIFCLNRNGSKLEILYKNDLYTDADGQTFQRNAKIRCRQRQRKRKNEELIDNTSCQVCDEQHSTDNKGRYVVKFESRNNYLCFSFSK